jgi:hemolysin III
MSASERFNSITHLVGAALTLVGVSIMVTLAALEGGAVRILTLTV